MPVFATRMLSFRGETQENNTLPRLLGIQNDFDTKNTLRRFYNHTMRPLLQSTEISTRVASISFNSIFRRQGILILGVSMAAVYGMAAYEAHLMLLEPNAEFVRVYAEKCVLPSIIWQPLSPELVCHYIGIDPSSVLDPCFCSGHIPTQVEAQLILKVANLSTSRYLLANFMVMAQIMRMVNITLKARERYKDRVSSGNEPTLRHDPSEKIIRLAGHNSDSTRLAMARYGVHILPVFETVNHSFLKKKALIHKKPFWWSIRVQGYGELSSWERLGITRRWGLKTMIGHRVLVIEADAVNNENILQLGMQSHDLTIANAAQAFRAIETVARTQNAVFDSILRVYLADSLQTIVSGGGYEYTLKEVLARGHEADVFIDAVAPLVSTLLKWCHENASSPLMRSIMLETDDSIYFRVLKGLLKNYGYDIIDPAEFNDEDSSTNSIQFTSKYNGLRIIYHPNTFLTVNTVYSLLRQDLANPNAMCAIVERFEGKIEIMDICNMFDTHINIICLAELHDDLFKEVRLWTRMDCSPEVIQSTLDRRYRPVLYHAENVKTDEDIIANSDTTEDKKKTTEGNRTQRETTDLELVKSSSDEDDNC